MSSRFSDFSTLRPSHVSSYGPVLFVIFLVAFILGHLMTQLNLMRCRALQCLFCVDVERQVRGLHPTNLAKSIPRSTRVTTGVHVPVVAGRLGASAVIASTLLVF